MPVNIYNSAIGVIGNNAYFMGGFTETNSEKTYVYNSEMKEWSEGPGLSAAKSSACAVVIKNTVYVIAWKTQVPGSTQSRPPWSER